MRLRLVAMCLISSFLASPLVGAEPFPYRAVVTADEATVRSGPGESYYSVQKLTKGEKVEVWRHDPGGWYAIRPPEGAFSWVASEFIKPTDGGLGVVIGERVVARVGSIYSDIRDCIQVRLDKGEEVEILDVQRAETGEGPRSWYKIAPPAGEFRWVQGRFFENEQRVQRTANQKEPSNDQPASVDSKPATSTSEPTLYDKSPAGDSKSVDDTKLPTPGSGGDKLMALERRLREMSAQLEVLNGKKPAPGWVGKDGVAADGRVLPASKATTVPAALAECELLLSQTVADDTLVWDFRQLTTRVEELLSRSESAADRSTARALLLKIEKFEDIRQRYMTVVAERNAANRTPPSAVTTRLTRKIELKTDDGGDKYDGVGRLTQVVSQKPGAPQFALLDDDGKVLYYVSAAPGVNLRAYLDRDVGVTGILGILPDQNARHVTAKRIEPLDGRMVR